MSSQIGRYSGKLTGGNPGFPAGVKNGKVPQNLLRHLDSQPVTAQFPESEHWLAHDAAIGLDLMTQAAKEDGVHIRLLEAYRTYERQVYFWDLYQSGKGNLAAHPGTSNHGLGVAIDVDRSDPHSLPWMRLHAIRFGWDLPDELGRREPWHWQWIVGHPAGATLPPVKETPVYVHGELLAGAYAGFATGISYVFLRTVAEELGWDVEAKDLSATLTRGTKAKTINFMLQGNRAVVPARKLGELLGATVDWDGQAVRIS